MATKLKKFDSSDDNSFVEAVRGSVEQIWQAGLGAFAKAQQEGEELFSRLVQEGMEVQKRTQQLAGERLSELSETVVNMAGNLGKQASGSFDRLENVFEDRVSRSLRGLGVPTHDDIQALSEQIGNLQKSVNALVAKQKTQKSVATKPAAKAAPKKAAAKPMKSGVPKGRAGSNGRRSASLGRV